MVFDNSDNRFPTGRNEVVLRRTIGLKKDEYSLDRKSATKSEVMNLLTSAGFSKANPYYIVPQGRIAWLTNAKDNERLELLKEVAGTTLYEEHRKESLKLMEESTMKREKIDEMLEFIEERLQELEEERRDLVEFMELDKQKRACEYTAKHRELEKTRNELVSLDTQYHGDTECYESEKKAHTQLLESFQKSKEQEELNRLLIAENDDQLKRLNDEKNEILKAKARFDFMQKQQTFVNSKTISHEEREKIALKIDQKQNQLEQKVIPNYQEKLTIENGLREQLATLEVKRDHMTEMQGKFRNERERNAWIRKEIGTLQQNTQQESEEQKKLIDEIANTNETLVELSVEIDNLMGKEKEISERETSNLNDYMNQRNQLSEKRKDIWKKESQVRTEISIKKNEILKIEKNLHLSGCPVSVMQSVDKIVQELGLGESYYGPIYRLISLESTYFEAVDAIAGNGLFHIVVDTDQTAKQILTILQERRLGRVTFIPLNRINPREVSYPINNNDGIPLISVLRFDSVVEKAIREVFSKYFICPSLEIASKIAKSHNLNTVTLDGDKADKRGVLTGGYSKSGEHQGRLEILINYKNASNEVVKKEQKISQYVHQVKSLDLQINSFVSKIFQQENEKMKIQNALDEVKSQLTRKQQERALLERNCEQKNRAVQNYSLSINTMKIRLNSLEEEKNSPFVPSNFEEDSYKAVQHQVSILNQELMKVMKEKSNIECLKSALQDEIENYKKRLHQFDQLASDFNFSDENVVNFNPSSLDSLQTQIDTLLKSIEESRATLLKVTKSSESLIGQIEESSKRIANLSSNASSYTSIRTILTQKVDSLNDQIKQLGILSSDFLNKFRKMNDSTISNQLHQLNDKLKKYTHVNKKATEQYQSFIDQRSNLLERKKELSTSSSSVTSFVAALDQQKDQAILRTFEQVSEYFTEIFSRLVPTGSGELLLVREENSSTNQIELKGIQIKVSFDHSNPSLLIGQLSGGQKSVVALAFIFAIQKVDPAPFYLFDEIDANLDSAYRTNVATLLHELSRSAQYITTTFRPELLEQADKFYGVQFVNRVSNVGCITKEAAIEFVEKQIVK